MFDLAAELPRLIPRAVAWAEGEERRACNAGEPLSEASLRLARSVGVEHPERVRVVRTGAMPFPTDPELSLAATRTGFLGPGTAGLTLGYAVFLRTGHESNRLISHECRHVHQYEAAGSIATFLPLYLRQIVTYGYRQAPFEIDARAHERDAA